MGIHRMDWLADMEDLLDPRDEMTYTNKNNQIIRNSAICNKCHEEITSRYTHDFVTCGCGGLSVDGGTEYLRRIFGAHGYVDTTIMDVNNS